MPRNPNARSWLDRATAWSPVLLLGSLAALTYWLDAQVQAPQPRRDGSARHDADLFVEGVRAVKLDTDGNPLQSLTARRADHFGDDQTTEFKDIALALTQPGKPPFRVTAREGTLSGDRENISFKGNVRAIREAMPASGAEEAQGPVTLTTEYLHVQPNRETADTDKPVTITDPRGTINATGMEFDNKTKSVNFKSRVSGQLQPKK